MAHPIVICGTPEYGIEARARAIAGVPDSIRAASSAAHRAVVAYGEFAAAFGLTASNPSDMSRDIAAKKRRELQSSFSSFARAGHWNGQVWYVGHSIGGGAKILIGGYNAAEFTRLAARHTRPANETRQTYLASSSVDFHVPVGGADFAVFLRQCIPLHLAPKATRVSVVMLACWIGDNKAAHNCAFVREAVPMLNGGDIEANCAWDFANLVAMPTVAALPSVLMHATKFETWYGNGSTVSVNGVRAKGFSGGDTWEMFRNLKAAEREGTLEKGAFNVHLHQDYLEATVKPRGAGANWKPPPKVMFGSLQDVLTRDYASVSQKPTNTGKKKHVFTTYFWSAGYGAVCRDKSNKLGLGRAAGTPGSIEVCADDEADYAVEWIDSPYLA